MTSKEVIKTPGEVLELFNLLNEYKTLFSAISDMENSIERFFSQLVEDESQSNTENKSLLIHDLENYIKGSEELVIKYQSYKARFDKNIKAAESLVDIGYRRKNISFEEVTKCYVFKKLKDMVINQIFFIEEKKETNLLHLRLIKGGLHPKIVKSFTRVVYTEQDALNDDDSCCICLLSRTTCQVIMVLPCGHKYHEKCGEELFENSYCCAMCKRSFR